MLKVIGFGLQHLRTVKKCVKFVNVSAFIEFLKSNNDYMIPGKITRSIISEGIVFTFASLFDGATFVVRDINLSKVAVFTSFSGLFASSASNR